MNGPRMSVNITVPQRLHVVVNLLCALDGCKYEEITERALLDYVKSRQEDVKDAIRVVE